MPQWNALFGSGGRASAAVAGVASLVELYTYRPPERKGDLYPLEAMGVRTYSAPSESEYAFAYFHPLSNPVIAPRPNEIKAEAPLSVKGETVLRFGFLEGDAIVEADRAVYDPQAVDGARPFPENGSQAETLAIVLNEDELNSAVGPSDVDAAAQQLIARDGASVVIVKGGIKGAQLYYASGDKKWIPAYESTRVFKIGSGDVFTGAFTYYWGEARLEPAIAADLASRSVAHYCGSRSLPLPPAQLLQNFRPVGSRKLRPVLLAGAVAAIGSRWTLEEARSCLGSLGLEVVAPALGSAPAGAKAIADCGAFLLIADLMDDETLATLAKAAELKLPTVVLSQAGGTLPDTAGRLIAKATDDFVTAIYLAGWAAAERSVSA